jgi:hypothetical protein
MKRFVEGLDRGQSTLFPECLEDWIGEGNPVRVIDVFVDQLDLGELGSVGLVSSLVEALYLRLPQPHSVEPPAQAHHQPAIKRIGTVLDVNSCVLNGHREASR